MLSKVSLKCVRTDKKLSKFLSKISAPENSKRQQFHFWKWLAAKQIWRKHFHFGSAKHLDFMSCKLFSWTGYSRSTSRRRDSYWCVRTYFNGQLFAQLLMYSVCYQTTINSKSFLGFPTVIPIHFTPEYPPGIFSTNLSNLRIPHESTRFLNILDNFFVIHDFDQQTRFETSILITCWICFGCFNFWFRFDRFGFRFALRFGLSVCFSFVLLLTLKSIRN